MTTKPQQQTSSRQLITVPESSNAMKLLKRVQKKLAASSLTDTSPPYYAVIAALAEAWLAENKD
jgi:hypothetical protein